MKMPIEFVICHSMCETCLQAEVPWGMKRDLNVLAVLQMLATCLPQKLASATELASLVFEHGHAWASCGIIRCCEKQLKPDARKRLESTGRAGGATSAVHGF
jgi:hypothetical protein